MTITAVWPLLIAVAGLLLWLLAPDGRLKKIGMVLGIIGAFWFIGSLQGKAVKLGAIGDYFIGTAHAQTDDGSLPADDDVPEPTADDPSSPIDQGAPDIGDIATAWRSGRWLAVAGSLLLLAVWLVRAHGSRLLGERFGAWIRTDRGGIAVSTALGVASSMGIAMAAGRAPSIEDLVAGLNASALASGMYVMGRRIMVPSPNAGDGSVVPPPEPEPEGKAKRSKRPSSTAEG